ncbi:MAG: DUF1439 domain-containing protein, partial [Hydrogenophaga sp.]|nr:DUF1439 domain-containing protein [Hydrogenophaga sp.]
MNTSKLSSLRWLVLLFLAWGLSACGVLQPGPRSIDLSEAKLAAMIGDRFPFNSRYLELFDVVLDRPQVRLIPAENR